MKVSVFYLSVFACKDFSRFHCTKSPEPSEGLVLISRTWPSDDGHRPVPTPGCVFGKVGRGGGHPLYSPQYFPPTGFPRVSKCAWNKLFPFWHSERVDVIPLLPSLVERGVCVWFLHYLRLLDSAKRREGRVQTFLREKEGCSLITTLHPKQEHCWLLRTPKLVCCWVESLAQRRGWGASFRISSSV